MAGRFLQIHNKQTYQPPHKHFLSINPIPAFPLKGKGDMTWLGQILTDSQLANLPTTTQTSFHLEGKTREWVKSIKIHNAARADKQIHN